jgi:tripartite-type tricarboxylate transporter receptor subunit TctC
MFVTDGRSAGTCRRAGVRRVFMPWRVAVSFIVAASAALATAQPYPSKPVRIVTAEAAGASDVAARMVGQGMAARLGQNVIVENRGGGVIPGETVAKALPDGYTLLFFGGALWTAPLLQKTPYDVVRDFAPITSVVKTPSVLVVVPSLPVKSVKDVIALVKAKPGVLNYGSASTGTSNHLAAELFKSMAAVDIVRVPCKGSGQALNALVANEVQIMFSSAGSVAPFVQAAKLKALAVTSAHRSALMPELPTVADSGVPDYESVSTYAMFAPARTPAAVVARLNQEITRVIDQPEVRERFLKVGVETAGSTPEQLAILIKAEMGRIGKIIKSAGIASE